MEETREYGSPQEQPCASVVARRRLTIGVPSCNDASERRFPLTPEGVKVLVEKGYTVKIEREAARPIHYCDNAYMRCGAEVTDRSEALGCDIVIHLAPLNPSDLRHVRRGAMLLTLLNATTLTQETVRAMQSRAIVGVAIDCITDAYGKFPFSDILAEIDGRAAISSASSLLADAGWGKGILLGGIAGIVPCEVTIIGSGIAATAAARSATGLGATVRMFDDDVYSLREAVRDLGPQVITSVIHEHVLMGALRSADVVVVTRNMKMLSLGADCCDTMKRGVVIFDLSPAPGRVFPSLPSVNLSDARRVGPLGDRRVCYINAGSAVPRTAAMALSNTFNTLLDSIVTCDGVTNALKLTSGLRNGVFMFLGKVTDPRVARIAGCRFTDINIYLQMS